MVISAPPNDLGQDNHDVFQTLFKSTGWGREDRQLTDFTGLTIENFSAVFLHYPAIESIIEKEQKTSKGIQNLKKLDLPVIVFSPELNFKIFEPLMVGWSISGLISESETLVNIKKEVEEIIECYETKLNQQKKAPPQSKWQSEEWIEYYLCDTTVCFRHWRNFFRRKAHEDVFDATTLEFLLRFDWRRFNLDLQHTLRFALFRAISFGANKVTLGHLPQRFSDEAEHFAKQFEFENNSLDELQEKSFLKKANEAFADNNSMEDACAKLGIKGELELRKKVWELRAKYPHYAIKRNFEHLFKALPVRIWVESGGGKSSSLASEYSRNYLQSRGHHIELEVVISDADLKISPQEFIDTHHIFLFFICQSLLANSKSHDRFLNVWEQKGRHLISIFLAPADLTSLEKYLPGIMKYPQTIEPIFNKNPLADSSFPIQNARELSDVVLTGIDNLW